MQRNQTSPDGRRGLLRVGSLFSGYGGLDLAVEEVFDAETVWFSEINRAVARVFSHHWPTAPNLGDIAGIGWSTVEPVDVLCGGFPCQDVSIVGRRAGLAPGTRSGLWARMAEAVGALQPEWVVAENVRGLTTTHATRAQQGASDERVHEPFDSLGAALRDLESDAGCLGDPSTRPLRALGAVLGDLADLRYDVRWVGLPASAVGAPHPRYRIFILARRRSADPGRVGLGAGSRDDRGGQGAKGDGSVDSSVGRAGRELVLGHGARRGGRFVDDRGAVRRWGRYAAAISRWERLTGRPAPDPTVRNSRGQARPAPEFVEWLMGLEHGWVTDPALGLSDAQQLTALGNGVVPRQAVAALRHLRERGAW